MYECCNAMQRCEDVMQNKEKMGYISSYNGLLRTKIGKIPIHYQSNYDTPQQISICFSFTNSIWELRPIEILSVYEEMEIIEVNLTKTDLH